MKLQEVSLSTINRDKLSPSVPCAATQRESTSDPEIYVNGSVRENDFFFKSEKFKAFAAFILHLVSFFLTLISLAIVHDKLPDRKVYKPLPDIVLDNVGNTDFLQSVSDIHVILILNMVLVVIVFHKHR